MRVITRVSLAIVAALALGGGQAWAQANACEASPSTGAAGCGTTPVSILHGGFGTVGAFDLSGSDFDGECVCPGCPGSTCGAVSPTPPIIRFWAYNAWATKNAAMADRLPSGAAWLANPNQDFGLGSVPANFWGLFQANWASTSVLGCIAAGERNVVELSFCDSSGPAMYLVASALDPSAASFDYDSITGGVAGPGCASCGVPLNVVPVPVPVASLTMMMDRGDGFGDAMIDLSAVTLREYSELGAGMAGTIKGLELLYFTGTTAPAATCKVGLGTWLPARNPATPSANLGPVAGGAIRTVSVPVAPSTMTTWFAARVVYRDSSTMCGMADACLDPQTQGTPTSCFGPFSRGIPWGMGTMAVRFVSASATWDGSAVIVDWKTAEELDTAGFRILRADSAAGPWSVVGSTTARGPGYDYSVADTTVSQGQTYYYMIEERLVPGASGEASSHGPMVVTTTTPGGGSYGGRDRGSRK